jgi:hypothetical protein
MAYTQAQLDALDADIANFGIVEQTSFADQATRFRSLDELLKLRAVMAAAVAAQTSTTGGSRTRYAAFDKGV